MDGAIKQSGFDPRSLLFVSMQFGMQKPALDSPQVKTEYLSCLKHLSNLISDSMNDGRDKSKTTTLQELNDEIKRVEAELSPRRKQRNSNF